MALVLFFDVTYISIFTSFFVKVTPGKTWVITEFLSKMVMCQKPTVESQVEEFNITLCFLRPSDKALWWRDGMFKKNSFSNWCRKLVVYNQYIAPRNRVSPVCDEAVPTKLANPGILSYELQLEQRTKFDWTQEMEAKDK